MIKVLVLEPGTLAPKSISAVRGDWVVHYDPDPTDGGTVVKRVFRFVGGQRGKPVVTPRKVVCAVLRYLNYMS